MQRREFILKTASLAATGLVLGGCAATATTTATSTEGSNASPEKRRNEINAGVDAVLPRLYSTVRGSRELVAKANGVLVFPSVIAAGLGIGGQYGEGALRVHSESVAYYNLASVSVGLQIGAQSKAVILLFMTQESLDKFRNSEGWSAGADASVAVLKVGANGEVDINATQGPIVAFVLTNSGLMANLTLEGTKITRIKM
ncbi:MAG: BPSL1445 family SYLF domain-containing lipoprotein [Burkholderiaceae bacterium]